MCIFNKDVAVDSTKVLAGVLELDEAGNATPARVLGYSNKVTATEDAVMIIALPAYAHTVEMYDTRAYKDFLEDMAVQVMEIENRRMRGVVSKGFSLGMTTVGQYEVAVVDSDELFPALEQLGQPIPSWGPELFGRYAKWSFLLVLIKAGDSVDNQPFLVTYEQRADISDSGVYFPLMDVHGDEPIQETAVRNHVVMLGHPKFKTPNRENPHFVAETPGIPDFLKNLVFAGFSLGVPRGTQAANGDIWTTLHPTLEDPYYYHIDFVNPTQPAQPGFESLYTYAGVLQN
jgi:hypothetical protein